MAEDNALSVIESLLLENNTLRAHIDLLEQELNSLTPVIEHLPGMAVVEVNGVVFERAIPVFAPPTPEHHCYHFEFCPHCIEYRNEKWVRFDNRFEAFQSGYKPCKTCGT